MNPTHVHLVITHLPIYGTILGTVVLVIGMITRSRETKLAAYILLLISSVGGFVAYTTGEPAEETVEHIAGISENLIEEHEEFASVAIVFLGVMAVLSFAGLFIARMGEKLKKAVSILILIVSLATFLMVSWTGYLGGKIRHTEINDQTLQKPDN
jgi:uncharacterized membrane protein